MTGETPPVITTLEQMYDNGRNNSGFHGNEYGVSAGQRGSRQSDVGQQQLSPTFGRFSPQQQASHVIYGRPKMHMTSPQVGLLSPVPNRSQVGNVLLQSPGGFNFLFVLRLF
ncbi:hypothetical protein CTI12_AA230890 [Artemisia annua]|uniref:Uncharacterized protein n=1 Tax=Artemisia annua TaxID=35608 RepID=A0A2U1NSV8_ARTAN|nr:hypothetical protein CTI12_AA230890 [Artemisia annua]